MSPSAGNGSEHLEWKRCRAGCQKPESGEAKEDRTKKPGGEKVGGVVKAEKKKASEAGLGMMLGERAKGWKDHLNHH